jgi:hypothetical protein
MKAGNHAKRYLEGLGGMFTMPHSREEQLIENYFSQSAFKKLVMYPTLAPQLVPAALHDSLGIRTTSIETLASENSNVSTGGTGTVCA